MMIRKQYGMTLIEVLVAATISVIIAGAALVIFTMFNTQTKETNAYLVMQMQYENLSEQIAFDTHMAHKILDTADIFYEASDIVNDTVTAFYYYSVGPPPVAGIAIEDDRLREFRDDTWKDFHVGNGIVLLDTANSYFVLNGRRQGVALHLRLKQPGPDTTYYLSPRKDEFICRN